MRRKKTAELRVGATAGPHAANVQKAAEVAKKQGLNVKVMNLRTTFPRTRAGRGFFRYRNLSARAVPQQFQQAAGLHTSKISV